jgi:hypothetical protein
MDAAPVHGGRREVFVEIHDDEHAAHPLHAVDLISKVHSGIVSTEIMACALDPNLDPAALTLDPGRVIISGRFEEAVGTPVKLDPV